MSEHEWPPHKCVHVDVVGEVGDRVWTREYDTIPLDIDRLKYIQWYRPVLGTIMRIVIVQEEVRVTTRYHVGVNAGGGPKVMQVYESAEEAQEDCNRLNSKARREAG